MEVVTIEKQVFESMMNRFEKLVQTVESLLHETNEKRLEQWLDNQDVCRMLGVSLRTVQTYRSNGTLPYSQVGHKMFYRQKDIDMLLQRLTPPQ